MGKALFQSVTVPKDQININNDKIEIENAQPRHTLPISSISIQSENPLVPMVPKENIEAHIISFEANFNDHDDISDMDLLSALCAVDNNIAQVQIPSSPFQEPCLQIAR